MSDQLTLSAETRDRVGKGASRALRRDGRIPAVIYGDKQDPLGISVNERELVRLLGTGHFMNTVLMIDTGGGRPTRTLPKDVSFDPVSDRPMHVDFFRISEHSTVTVAVPVVFVDQEESEGLGAGGVLNVVRHEIELVVDASDIPSELTISLKGRAVGDSIHISDVALPGNAKPAVEDRDFTVATIVPPTVPTAADEAADAEVAEAAETTEAGEDEAEPAEGDEQAEGGEQG